MPSAFRTWPATAPPWSDTTGVMGRVTLMGCMTWPAKSTMSLTVTERWMKGPMPSRRRSTTTRPLGWRLTPKTWLASTA